MKVVSQNINIFNPRVYEAVTAKDAGFIQDMAKEMVANGADAIEINLGGWRTSDDVMPWMVSQVRKVTDCPLFLSPIPSSLKDAVEADSLGKIFINCVTADGARLDSMLNAASCLNTSIVVLLTKKGFLPATLDELLLLAEDVLEKAEKKGFPLERILLDPVLRPRLSMAPSGGMVNRPNATFFAEALALIGLLREEKIGTCAAIGSLSLGMPESSRKGFEMSAARLFKGAGLDYLIMDCSNRRRIKEIKDYTDSPDIIPLGEHIQSGAWLTS